MKNNLKTSLMIATAAIAIGAPLTGYAYAQSNATQQVQTRQKSEKADTDIKGSIQVPTEKQGVELTDTEEQAQYQKLAKITAEQAKQAAGTVVKGTVDKVELDEEDGFLVYEVKIGNTEVLVDAGNGAILEQEVN